MTDQLLAYLLDDLSPDDRTMVERRLQSDPAWRHELARLRDCLAGCGDPQECGCHGESDEARSETSPAAPLELATTADVVEPPADLAKRTCTLVESGVYSLQALVGEAAAPPCRWRMADFALAAGVLLALGSVTMPAMVQSREAARREACADNLRALSRHLVYYAENHNQELPPIALGQNAGMYAVALAEHTGIDRAELARLLACPGSRLALDVASGRMQIRVPTMAELADARPPVLIAIRQQMGGSYAYRFGYVDQKGEMHQVRFTGADELPMLADAPEAVPGYFHSTAHGPCGQNVLYQSQTVRFVSGCCAPGGDNLFLNLSGQHAAGLASDDYVLGRGEVTPLGTIIPVEAKRGARERSE